MKKLIKPAGGFTLFEVLVTIAVLAVIALLAAPAFQSWLARLDANLFQRQMILLINEGSSQAALARQPHSLCGGVDDCSGDWQAGVILFIDQGTRGVIDGDDRIVRQIVLTKRAASLTWRGSLGQNYINFMRPGSASRLGSNGTFTYCGSGAEYHRQVSLNRNGTARLSVDANGDGRHEPVVTGASIPC